jgi:hypothetical protein
MADEHVFIALQHKQRRGKTLAVVKSNGVTVRGLPLDTVYERLKQLFAKELAAADVGIFNRPKEQVLAQLQHYTRPGGKTLKYVKSRSLTVPNVNLQTVLRRIRDAFSAPALKSVIK